MRVNLIFCRPALPAAASLAFAAGAVLLTGCASVRLDAPAASPVSPAVTGVDARADADRYPAPQPRVWTGEPVGTPRPSSADATAVTLAAPAAPVALADPPAAPADAASRAAPASATAPQTPSPDIAAAALAASPAWPAPADPLPPGRWSVQVGAFAVPQNAEALRLRLVERDPALPAEGVRMLVRDGRTRVLVGNLPDKVTAEKLAALLKRRLQQDVVLFRW